MSKSETSDCNCRTINLAKQGNSLHERRTKLLVYEQDKNKTFHQKPSASLPVGITSTPSCVKRIRVCTGADLRKACPPVMCDCKRKVPLTTMAVIGKSMFLGIKCLIAGGLVYWTWNIGLWGDAARTEKLWVNMRNMFTDNEATDMGDETGQSPRLDKTTYKGKAAWNRLVSGTFNLLSKAAISAGQLFSQEDIPCEKK